MILIFVACLQHLQTLSLVCNSIVLSELRARTNLGNATLCMYFIEAELRDFSKKPFPLNLLLSLSSGVIQKFKTLNEKFLARQLHGCKNVSAFFNPNSPRPISSL